MWNVYFIYCWIRPYEIVYDFANISVILLRIFGCDNGDYSFRVKAFWILFKKINVHYVKIVNSFLVKTHLLYWSIFVLLATLCSSFMLWFGIQKFSRCIKVRNNHFSSFFKLSENFLRRKVVQCVWFVLFFKCMSLYNF